MPVNRLGPPMPRNEPWRPPVPPLPEQPGRTPVPAREAAYAGWMRDTGQSDGGFDTGRAEAFAAGWDAARDPDEAMLDTASLFPTMGLAHDV